VVGLALDPAEWFRTLYDTTGINLSYIYDGFDRQRMLRGLGLTVQLAVMAMLFSVVIGLAGAWLQTLHSRLVRWIVGAFVGVFRNTPPLVQIYVLSFGFGYLIKTHQGDAPLFTNVQWAVISLSLFAGAFNIEIFRSGIEAVPRGMAEAAGSLGLSRWRAFRFVILPLALRNCLPALGNNLVELVKTTNLAYAIAVPELMYSAKQIWGDSANVTEMMLTVLFIYVVLTSLVAWGFRRTEAAIALPGSRRS
jgi:polar amino acid transport system permease protein